MKTWLFLLFLPVLAFAETSFQTVKVADGSIAECKGPVDAFIHKRGAYRLEAESPVIKGDWAIFDVKLTFLACKESQGSWGFQVVSPFSMLNYSLFAEEVQVETLDAFLTLTREEAFLTSMSWSPESHRVAVGLSDLMSSDEKALYETGAELELSVDFQLEKDLRFSSKSGIVSDERAVYGAYRRHFSLKK
ncbi:MAG: hypothetical protein K2P81_01275 [Bacteriovoracaceae bacterium]|nr:hypothetical protein [Bacteriovoracaceae bacterium]